MQPGGGDIRSDHRGLSEAVSLEKRSPWFGTVSPWVGLKCHLHVRSSYLHPLVAAPNTCHEHTSAVEAVLGDDDLHQFLHRPSL